MRTIKFISPLNIRLDDHEYEYLNEDEMPDVSPTEATYYADVIATAIERGKRDYDDGPRGLMAYFDGNPAIAAKVHSAYPAVEERNGKLMGVMVCEVKGHLTEAETAELEDYFTGQYSDGWGESFEQHEIKTSNGDLYVHFWDDRNFEIAVEDNAPSLLKSMRQKSEIAVSIERVGNTDPARAALLDLPATGPQIRDAFDRAGITDPSDITIKPIAFNACLHGLFPAEPELYELNYLAERLAAQAPHEKLFYKAVVKMETSPPDMKRLINLTGHLEDCQIAPAKNDAELGKFYAENDFIAELDSVSDKVFDMLDFAKIGKDMRESEHGVYIDGCYIVQPVSPEALEDFYHGNTPVPQLDEEFKLRIFVAAAHDTDNGVWLDLPATKHDLERTAVTLGVITLSECVYTDLQCEIPAMHKILSGRENIYDLDSLAETLQNIHFNGELPKFKAILETEPCVSLDDISLIAQNMGSYEWLYNLDSAADYGKKMFVFLNGLSQDSAGLDCVDFQKFGEERMKIDNVQSTAYGMVKLIGDGQILAQAREISEAPEPRQAETQKPAEPSMTMNMGW